MLAFVRETCLLCLFFQLVVLIFLFFFFLFIPLSTFWNILSQSVSCLCFVNTNKSSFVNVDRNPLHTGPCGNGSFLKVGRCTTPPYAVSLESYCSFLGHCGAAGNNNFQEAQSKKAFTLCRLHFLAETTMLWRSDQCFSDLYLRYASPINYIQYEGVWLQLTDLIQSKRKHWHIRHKYTLRTQKINIILSLPSSPSLSRRGYK